MAKPSSKINERERAICARFRRFRELLNCSQTDFADQIGITRNQLAAIEREITPLQHVLVDRAVAVFKLNPIWLATGNSNCNHISFGKDLFVTEKAQIKKRELFSSVFDKYLKSEDKFFGASSIEHARIFRIREFCKHLTHWFQRVPDIALQAFAENLHEQAELFLAKYQSEGDALLSQRSVKMHEIQTHFQILNSWNESKEYINIPDPLFNFDSMNLEAPTWTELKKEIAQLTSERGEKAALAARLHVSRQVLGNWLASGDKGAPNAETTLFLLNWVRGKKAKQNKNPETVRAVPGQTTSIKGNSYETKKSKSRKK